MCLGTGACLKEQNIFCSKVLKEKTILNCLHMMKFGMHWTFQALGDSYVTHNAVNSHAVEFSPCVISI